MELRLYENLDKYRKCYNVSIRKLASEIGIDIVRFKKQRERNEDLYFKYFNEYSSFANRHWLTIDDLFYKDLTEKEVKRMAREYHQVRELIDDIKRFENSSQSYDDGLLLFSQMLTMLQDAYEAGDFDIDSCGATFVFKYHYKNVWEADLHSPRLDSIYLAKGCNSFDNRGSWTPKTKGDRSLITKDVYSKYMELEQKQRNEMFALDFIREWLELTFLSDFESYRYKDVYIDMVKERTFEEAKRIHYKRGRNSWLEDKDTIRRWMIRWFQLT